MMLDETNVFDRSPHMVNVEREADEPNERGAASESIEQLKADFFVNGSDLPTGTGDGVQNGLSQLASAFDVSLFELELDVIAQTVSVNDPTQTVSVI